MKKLSVIVPVYNAGQWVQETLESLCAQTYPEIEIICVDDGSTDNSCQIIKAMQSSCDNITLIQQKNSGVSAARNTGIAHANGEYIAFIDADDRVELNTYKEMIAQLEREESDIVFCEFVRFWPNGKVQYTVEENFKNLVKHSGDIRYFLYSTKSRVEGNTHYTQDIHGSSCRSVFKKNIIDYNNIQFPTDMKFAEDQVFVLNYLSYVQKVSYTNKPYVWYRGFTKPRRYLGLYENNMNLLQYQKQVLSRNQFYSKKEKRQICGYLDCSTYFMIINEEFVFNPDVAATMSTYVKNAEFRKLLTVYSFIRKFKVRPEPKRIFLFVLLKLRLWNVVKHFYPNKRY